MNNGPITNRARYENIHQAEAVVRAAHREAARLRGPVRFASPSRPTLPALPPAAPIALNSTAGALQPPAVHPANYVPVAQPLATPFDVVSPMLHQIFMPVPELAELAVKIESSASILHACETSGKVLLAKLTTAAVEAQRLQAPLPTIPQATWNELLELQGAAMDAHTEIFEFVTMPEGQVLEGKVAELDLLSRIWKHAVQDHVKLLTLYRDAPQGADHIERYAVETLSAFGYLREIAQGVPNTTIDWMPFWAGCMVEIATATASLLRDPARREPWLNTLEQVSREAAATVPGNGRFDARRAEPHQSALQRLALLGRALGSSQPFPEARWMIPSALEAAMRPDKPMHAALAHLQLATFHGQPSSEINRKEYFDCLKSELLNPAKAFRTEGPMLALNLLNALGTESHQIAWQSFQHVLDRFNGGRRISDVHLLPFLHVYLTWFDGAAAVNPNTMPNSTHPTWREIAKAIRRIKTDHDKIGALTDAHTLPEDAWMLGMPWNFSDPAIQAASRDVLLYPLDQRTAMPSEDQARRARIVSVGMRLASRDVGLRYNPLRDQIVAG